MRPRGERSTRLSRAVSATVGDRYTTTASAGVVGSWIRRLSHHHMVPCELWDAQIPARRPHRRLRRFRYEVELEARRAAADSAHGNVFFITVSAEAVTSSIGRLPQHRMMLFNVCGAWELFCRPLTGLHITYLLL
jgi:hypothetical protein